MTKNISREQLKQLPNCPGVYLMKDAEEIILYVGKSAKLRQRVMSYFSNGNKLTPKTQQLVAKICDLDFYITSSEQEALVLELNLIKQYYPPYNVRLKDDKSFPYLKIDLNDEWPRIYITRKIEENGGRYFGPFTNAQSVRQTLKLIKRLFPFRSCSKPITGTNSRPCLWHHMGSCLAPCVGTANKKEYDDVIKQVILFLEGKQEQIIKKLERNMTEASEALQFEKAALLRDQIKAVSIIIEEQRIMSTAKGEQDVIAFSQDKDQTCVQVFFIRGGKLVGRENFVLQGTSFEEPEQIMTSFVKQFYNLAPHIPPRILLQYPIEDMEIIEEWLSGKRGSKVHIMVPRRGEKRQLIDTVAENARHSLEQLKIKQSSTPKVLEAALAEVQRELKLPRLPERIEGYDISDIQGAAAVGSMVVFEHGKPNPSHYRCFKIKSVSGVDDYAMLKEVLRRRFKRSQQSGSVTSNTWAVLPDLVLIDGGKGHLNAARTALEEAGVDFLPAASLAKENEEVFVPGKSQPVVLPRSSPGLQLLQRLRDEAHRFAVSYYHKVHRRKSFASRLDSIPGIGYKRKRELLRRFGSVEAIKAASLDDLSCTRGITKDIAQKIKEYL